MNHTAPAKYPIEPLLAERWSPYAFSGRRVEEEKLAKLFEAARWAPSSGNQQPWSFIVTFHGTDDFERMAACLDPGNAWAKSAPVLALSVAQTHAEGGAKVNRTAMHDTGLAVGNLLVQATVERLIVHQMAGFNVEQARVALAVPDGHEPVAMIAIGYYGDPAALPENLRGRETKPRTRKPASEFVFRASWGEKLWPE